MDAVTVLTTGDLARLRSGLASMAPASDDPERIERIRLLEELKSTVAAAQAIETAAFVASQRAKQRAAGVPESRVGRGVAAQVALARRESPYRAQRYTGWATILTAELPRTFAALRAGQVTEWRAMIVARESAWLSRRHRAQVDAELAPRLATLGDRRIEAAAKRIGYRLDPLGYVDRLRAAENDRRVTLRPAPDAMTRLSALLPVAQGVAAYTALVRAADSAVCTGDAPSDDRGNSAPRGRGQIMADTLVERLTGQSHAPDVPVEIALVMTDQALLGNHAGHHLAATPPEFEAPATVLGHGPVPAAWARRLVQRPGPDAPMWIRRLFRHPTTGQLAALDSHRRTFTAAQRLFLRIVADDTCSTPWCDAPVRHIDHVVPVERGGPTGVANGQGLCAACNHAKQAPGWSARSSPGRAVELTTPTGHAYRSAPTSWGTPLPAGVTVVRPDRSIMIDLVGHHRAA